MNKKKLVIIGIIIAILILLVPIPLRLKDGGSIEYKALLYSITKVHRLNHESITGYEDGIKFEILGMKIYDSTSYTETKNETRERTKTEDLKIFNSNKIDTKELVKFNDIVYGRSYLVIDYAGNLNNSIGTIDFLIDEIYFPKLNGETNNEKLLNAKVLEANKKSIILNVNDVAVLFSAVEGNGINEIKEDYINADNIITISNKSTFNINRLYEFIENTKVHSLNRKEDEIRIITYTIEGDTIIKDIKFVMNEDESYYEITTDTTQDKFGEQKVETKKYVSEEPYTIRIIEKDEYQEVCLAELPEINIVIPKISICSFKKDETLIGKRDFIATVIEEEPTYLIVEPNDGELEKLQSNTRKILIAGGENRDYLYGVGRKVIITYDSKIQNDTNTIIGATIDVDGYDDFELTVVESEKLEKRKILNATDLDKYNSNFDLYYYGLEEVKVKAANKEMTLENALKDGYLTLEEILAKANKDVDEVEKQYKQYYEYQSVPLILPRANKYRDGGSIEYQYETFVIVKFHTVDGNRDLYICKAGTKLNDLK